MPPDWDRVSPPRLPRQPAQPDGDGHADGDPFQHGRRLAHRRVVALLIARGVDNAALPHVVADLFGHFNIYSQRLLKKIGLP
ncbi:MAG: hypothetical protein R2911_34725 [Caldilineaceae bacterium]